MREGARSRWVDLQMPRRWDILRGYSGFITVPLYIKDDTVAELVARLARMRGLTKQAAVKLAVEAELGRTSQQVSVRDRLQKLWADNPLPAKTGKRADKAFFDDLSGGL
jgi:antitoxin VapB